MMMLLLFFGLGLIFIALARSPIGYDKILLTELIAVIWKRWQHYNCVKWSRNTSGQMTHAGGKQSPTLTRSSKPLQQELHRSQRTWNVDCTEKLCAHTTAVSTASRTAKGNQCLGDHFANHFASKWEWWNWASFPYQTPFYKWPKFQNIRRLVGEKTFFTITQKDNWPQLWK